MHNNSKKGKNKHTTTFYPRDARSMCCLQVRPDHNKVCYVMFLGFATYKCASGQNLDDSTQLCHKYIWHEVMGLPVCMLHILTETRACVRENPIDASYFWLCVLFEETSVLDCLCVPVCLSSSITGEGYCKLLTPIAIPERDGEPGTVQARKVLLFGSRTMTGA